MFWEKFLSLCAKNSTTPSAVCKKIGLSNATATHWRQGAQPNPSTLKKLAGFFGVSVDYLLGKEEKPSAENEELIRKLLNNPSGKATVVMFGGDGPTVVEISPEDAETVRRMLAALNKKDN